MEGRSVEPQPGSGPTEGPEPLPDRAGPAAGPALEPQRLPRVAWERCALFFLMHLLDTIDRWLVLGVLSQPQVREELKLDEAQMGWLSTVLLLGLRLRACRSAMSSTA